MRRNPNSNNNCFTANIFKIPAKYATAIEEKAKEQSCAKSKILMQALEMYIRQNSN
jgi:hypothetical protein